MDLLNDLFTMNNLINEIKTIIETPDNKLCSYFASVRHLYCLKYAYENRCVWYSDTCHYAAENGHFLTTKYNKPVNKIISVYVKHLLIT